MTVLNVGSSATVPITAGTANYPFVFTAYQDSHVVVTVRPAGLPAYTLAQGTGYTVDRNSKGVGGVVRLTPSLTITGTITIERVLPFSQELSFTNQALLKGESVERGLDYLIMQLQQIERRLTEAEIREHVYSAHEHEDGGADTFLELSDTPTAYFAGRIPVSTDEAIRFAAFMGANYDSANNTFSLPFEGLTNAPPFATGDRGKFLRAHGSEARLVYGDIGSEDLPVIERVRTFVGLAFSPLGELSLIYNNENDEASLLKSAPLFATNTEALAGAAALKIIAPPSLNYVLNTRRATTTQIGTTRLASGTSLDASTTGTGPTDALTTQALRILLDSFPGSTTRHGALRLATTDEAMAGVEHSKALTALGATAAIVQRIAVAKAEIRNEIVAGAPGMFDTLKEISDFLNNLSTDDHSALTAMIAAKLDASAARVQAITGLSILQSGANAGGLEIFWRDELGANINLIRNDLFATNAEALAGLLPYKWIGPAALKHVLDESTFFNSGGLLSDQSKQFGFFLSDPSGVESGMNFQYADVTTISKNLHKTANLVSGPTLNTHRLVITANADILGNDGKRARLNDVVYIADDDAWQLNFSTAVNIAGRKITLNSSSGRVEQMIPRTSGAAPMHEIASQSAAGAFIDGYEPGEAFEVVISDGSEDFFDDAVLNGTALKLRRSGVNSALSVDLAGLVTTKDEDQDTRLDAVEPKVEEAFDNASFNPTTGDLSLLRTDDDNPLVVNIPPHRRGTGRITAKGRGYIEWDLWTLGAVGRADANVWNDPPSRVFPHKGTKLITDSSIVGVFTHPTSPVNENAVPFANAPVIDPAAASHLIVGETGRSYRGALEFGSHDGDGNINFDYQVHLFTSAGVHKKLLASNFGRYLFENLPQRLPFHIASDETVAGDLVAFCMLSRQRGTLIRNIKFEMFGEDSDAPVQGLVETVLYDAAIPLNTLSIEEMAYLPNTPALSSFDEVYVEYSHDYAFSSSVISKRSLTGNDIIARIDMSSETLYRENGEVFLSAGEKASIDIDQNTFSFSRNSSLTGSNLRIIGYHFSGSARGATTTQGAAGTSETLADTIPEDVWRRSAAEPTVYPSQSYATGVATGGSLSGWYRNFDEVPLSTLPLWVLKRRWVRVAGGTTYTPTNWAIYQASGYVDYVTAIYSKFATHPAVNLNDWHITKQPDDLYFSVRSGTYGAFTEPGALAEAVDRTWLFLSNYAWDGGAGVKPVVTPFDLDGVTDSWWKWGILPSWQNSERGGGGAYYPAVDIPVVNHSTDGYTSGPGHTLTAVYSIETGASILTSNLTLTATPGVSGWTRFACVREPGVTTGRVVHSLNFLAGGGTITTLTLRGR